MNANTGKKLSQSTDWDSFLKLQYLVQHQKFPPDSSLALHDGLVRLSGERDSVRGSWKFSSIRSGGEFCWIPGVSLNPLSADSWAVALCLTSLLLFI